MTKTELITYMENYCLAEKSVRTLEDTKTQLKARLHEIDTPPELEKVESTIGTAIGVFIGSWIVSLIIIVVIEFILICIGTAICSFTKADFMQRLVNMYPQLIDHPWLTPVAIGAVVSLFLAVFPTIICVVDTKRRNKAMPSRNQVIMQEFEENRSISKPAIERELQQINTKIVTARQRLNKLAGMNILHSDYLNSSTIETLLEYLKKGRADTLKEAINLYESAKERFKQKQQEDEYRREMQCQVQLQLDAIDELACEAHRATEASERAADEARDAAFWGAAATYVADKARRESKK